MSDYNASERKHIRLAEKAAKVNETQRKDFVVAALSHVQGRAWFCDLLERCHVFSSSHTGNALNTAFAEGERNVGLQVLNDIHRHCPDQYVQMMREKNERDTTAEFRRGSDGRGDVEGREFDDGADSRAEG